MIEAYIRTAYDKVCVQPIARGLDRYTTIQPNGVTLLAILIGVLVLPLVLWQQTILACFALLVSGYLDSLDGVLARLKQRSTPVGTVLDICGDRLVEAVTVIALYSVDPTHRGLLCLLMLVSMYLCITTFLVVGLFSENTTHKSFFYSRGIMERPEAFLFFGLMLLLPKYFVVLSVSYTVLVLFTAGLRLFLFNSDMRLSHAKI